MQSAVANRPHVVFYNLTSSGASAIVPILSEILKEDFGYEIWGDPSQSENYRDTFDPDQPRFHWTHSPVEMFEPFLDREDFRFICLVRDPRDVFVSRMKDAKHQGHFAGDAPEAIYRAFIDSDFFGLFHLAEQWLQHDQPNVMPMSFEAMKSDIPVAVTAVLAHLGLEVDVDRIAAVCQRHSFEAVTGRQQGEDGPILRNAFMYRTGQSGNWKTEFSPAVKEAFHKKFGWLLERWGYHSAPATRPHVVFYNLTNSGGSALVPILKEILGEEFGYVSVGDPAKSNTFEQDFNGDQPTFHWTHSPCSVFEKFLARDDFRFICLTRDPRDVMVSHIKDVVHRGCDKGKSETELYAEYIGSQFNGMFEYAHEWRELGAANVHTLSFENMKADIPAAAREVFDFLGLPVAEETLRGVSQRHSFETVTQRQRGEEGPVIRNGLMFRKGINGDWKNQFDTETTAAFEAQFGKYLQHWGYAADSPVPAQANCRIASAMHPSGEKWLGKALAALGIQSEACNELHSEMRPTVLLVDGCNAGAGESQPEKRWIDGNRLPVELHEAFFNFFWQRMARVAPVKIVRIEDAAAHPEQALREILAFLGQERPAADVARALADSPMEKLGRSERLSAASSGLINEVRRHFGYAPAASMAETTLRSDADPEIHAAILKGQLPNASQWLSSRAQAARNENARLAWAAESAAVDWTHQIFGFEKNRSRAAHECRRAFGGLLQRHREDPAMQSLLSPYAAPGPRINAIGEYRGYQLARINGAYCALSPALGAEFELATQSNAEIIALAEHGLYIAKTGENALREAVDMLIDGILEAAAKQAQGGELNRAREVVQRCHAMTGGKDLRTNALENQLTHRHSNPALDWHRPLKLLDAEQVRQVELIRKSCRADRPLIAFYCPTKSFRNQFGELPELLRAAGYSVVKLYGEPADDAFEQSPNSFRVWDGMVGQMDFVDVFFVPTIMNCLPPRSKKVLFYHVSFAETEFEQLAREGRSTGAELPYDALRDQYKHLHAYLPLYDYIAVSSPHIKQHMETILQFYGRDGEVRQPRDCATLLEGLTGHRLAQTQTIIPAGYPPIDAAMRNSSKNAQPDKIITYAPTPLCGKPSWEPYASSRTHGPGVIAALLKAFPDYQIVFKPHPDDEAEIIRAIAAAGEGHPRFQCVLKSGHQDLYDRTALLISDFSSTAYTFALSRQRPVIFFSPFEDQLPDIARKSAYCQQRQSVGAIATTPEELVAAAKSLLSTRDANRPTTSELLYNLGRSDLELANQIDAILNDQPVAEWQRHKGGPITTTGNIDPPFSPMEIQVALQSQFGLETRDNALINEFQALPRVLGPHQMCILLPVLAEKVAGLSGIVPASARSELIGEFIGQAIALKQHEKTALIAAVQTNARPFADLGTVLAWVPRTKWNALQPLAEGYLIRQFCPAP